MPFRTHCAAPLRILPPEDLARLHTASLELLENPGVRFADPGALRFLENQGCQVDHQAQRVSFPPSLVEACLARIPDRFILRAREPRYNILFDTHSVHFSACSGMAVLEPESMQRRAAYFKDAEEAARLCDALENIAGSNSGLGWVEDKPQRTNLEWLYAAAIRNSAKVTSVGVMDDSEIWGIRMAQAAGEDIIVTVNSASPLGWTADQILGADRALEAGLPLGIQSMASMGVTAPATLAGSALMMNVEILAMAVYAQLRRPGVGLMYSCFTIPMDMRTTMLATGSIELGMLTAISAQLSKYYRMGSITYLPMTDAKLPDQQAGYEKGMQWLLAGAAGINLVWGAGMLEGHGVWSNAQLVLDAEMCGMVAHAIAAIPVNAETLAVDAIRQIGHFPASYLDSEHTLAWWRADRYLPLISSRASFESWQSQGGLDVFQRAAEKARALIAGHQPLPLSTEADREIEALLAAAARQKQAD